ncbi:peptidase S8/S53 domain-containing protein [Boeremia exigua]|uniref:peptidase S8/S53 domain-containing protein n=1 Tax=Boeremia exigua TaxID=749465 RepID=UPI001E8E17B1|nr:peptidase S8/S53 domain-containing protein [Boeremia exigua]KAH6638202.1 peptidase S8/S53 domain-containing protein [Boeremia exigua]
MRTNFAVAGLLALASSLLAAAAPQDGYIGNTTIQYMEHGDDAKELLIMFQKDEVPNWKQNLEDAQMRIKETDVIAEFNNTVFAGLVIRAGNHCIDAFNAMNEVAFVEEKTVIKSFVETKAGAPWGLQRISNAAGASGSPQSQDFTYSFDNSALGAGVDIYVIDTGVRTTHAVFTGRATQGFTATGSEVDGDGHGTHVAGTAGGAKFGVAQGANIIAVKVLGDDGSGSSTDTIAGMDWVINNHNKRKTQPGFVGSIMSMSWGLQGTARSVNEVITGASEAGIHVSVAAGNDGVDACGSTPAQLGGSNSNVVTVGSVNINNQVSTFSNLGKCVDIYAPGEEILSSWSTGDNIINFLSGTSMACPHTTGVMATLMAQDKSLGQDPAALKKKLLAVARSNDITGNIGGSANLMLSNGVDGGIVKRLVNNYVVPERTGSPAAQAMQKAKQARELERWVVVSDDSPLRF